MSKLESELVAKRGGRVSRRLAQDLANPVVLYDDGKPVARAACGL